MNLLALKQSHACGAFGPPLHDAVFRTVIALRGPRLNATLSDARTGRVVPIRVLQTHYKPYSRARLLAVSRVAAVDAVSEKLYVNVYANAQEARDEYDSAVSNHCSYGSPPFLHDGRSIVAWPLTNGPDLESARMCFDVREFARFLTDHHLPSAQSLPELVRYVPRKRALFRFSAGCCFYIKFYGPGRDEPAAANLALLARTGEPRFSTPRFLARDERSRAVVMGEVAGVPLTGLIADGASPESFANVGRALASLHQSDLEPAGSWTVERLLAALEKAMADVTLALPWITDPLHAVLELIVTSQPRRDERAPIHGNLFGDQILLDADRVGIVDWDDLGLGDPLYDIGRLIAHMIFVRLKTPAMSARDDLTAMVEAYVKETGRAMDWDRLRWHVAVALLMRAKISALRMLPSGWIEDIASSVGAAGSILTGRSAWLPA